ncbi:MAG: hypothetical protein AVDCRST_MAG76-3200, partial [uncultured Acidimicrobiales bacterium]
AANGSAGPRDGGVRRRGRHGRELWRGRRRPPWNRQRTGGRCPAGPRAGPGCSAPGHAGELRWHSGRASAGGRWSDRGGGRRSQRGAGGGSPPRSRRDRGRARRWSRRAARPPGRASGPVGGPPPSPRREPAGSGVAGPRRWPCPPRDRPGRRRPPRRHPGQV